MPNTGVNKTERTTSAIALIDQQFSGQSGAGAAGVGCVNPWLMHRLQHFLCEGNHVR